jgi:AraC-like DNA-binding protein
MEYSRILVNKKGVTEIVSGNKPDKTIAANFSVRLVLHGNETCTIGRRQLSVHSDSFLIINKGTQFSSYCDVRLPVNILSIEFEDDFLDDFNSKFFKGNKAILFDPEHCAYQLSETIYPFKEGLKNKIHQLTDYLKRVSKQDDIIKEYLLQCLFDCHKIYNEEILLKAKKLNFLHFDTRIEILRRLHLAKEYLYANYDKNISLDILANYACLSVNHLLRTFKLAYNQSPHQFLIQIRLQRAQLLLTKTEYPVYEIVNMVGFKCTSSFIRLFRNKYQTTPLKYRNVIA